MKKVIKINIALIALIMSGVLASHAQTASSGNQQPLMNRFYLSGSAGSSKVELKDESRNEEGIDFNFEGTDDSDMAISLMLGMRMSEVFALEAGYMDLGSVEQSFDFNDPRDGDNGSGMLKVSPSGTYIGASLMHDWNIFQFYVRGGVLMWDYDMQVRFDIVNGDQAISQRTQFSKDGTALLYGAGVRMKVAEFWSIGAQFDTTDIDGDTITVVGGAILFDVAAALDSIVNY
jgi:opacity protein-like surface antigen